MSKVKRSDITNNDGDRVGRIKDFVAENPDFFKDPGQRGYRWFFIRNLLKSLKEETGFETVMGTNYISQFEKDFIIFHIHEVKSLSEMTSEQFFRQVEAFKKEIEDPNAS